MHYKDINFNDDMQIIGGKFLGDADSDSCDSYLQDFS